MRKVYFLVIFAFTLCTLFSCQKDNNGSTIITPAKLIVGKWNLQQQKTLIYINGVMQTDTSFSASVESVGHLQFNADGTFNSASYTTQPLGIGSLSGGTSNIVSRDSTNGVYSISNSALTLNAPVAGFGNSFYAGSVTTVPVLTLISRSSQITQLTLSNLTLHIEYIYTATTSTESKTYKNELDYYYSK